MVLATFTLNDKEYIYSMIDNVIEYSYKTNDGEFKNLTDDEIKLMNSIYMKFVISKNTNNHKNCGVVNHNGKKFQIMYDKISERKFFYEIVNNNYEIPSYEDFLYLDSKLNPEVLNSEDSNLQNDNTDNKQNDQHQNKYTKVLICATFVLNILTICKYELQYSNVSNLNLGSSYGMESEMTNGEESVALTVDDLKQTLETNINLSSKEKEFILSNFSIIEDNIDYADMALINKRLKDLTFTYHDESYYDENGTRILGHYTSTNTIIIYECSSADEAIIRHSKVMSHELYHLFTCKFPKLGSRVNEAINEIMTLEYNDLDLNYHNYGTYSVERGAIYPLIELLGVDCMKEFYFKNDPQILINNLMYIIDDEDKAYELIGMIDNLHLEYNEQMRNCQNDDDEKQILADLYIPFNNLLNEYFVQKYGYDMSEDDVMQNYIYMQSPSVNSRPKAMSDFLLSSEGELGQHVSLNVDFILPYFSSELIHSRYSDGIPKQSIVIYDYIDGKLNKTQELVFDQDSRKNLNKINIP